MSDNTPITGELRSMMFNTESEQGTPMVELGKYRFTQLCDAIDAIHANLERENESLRRELDRVMGEQDHDGWVELPKDADGEYIRIGDMMERGKSRGHVIALMLSEYPKKWGGGLHWGVQLEGEQAPTALDAFFHHYHEPTVEDMLEEFVARWMETHPDDIPALKAEYAAKLRLAGE